MSSDLSVDLNHYLTNLEIEAHFKKKYDELLKFLSTNPKYDSQVLNKINDCLVYIEVPPKERFYLTFEKVNIHIYHNNSREMTTFERLNCTENFIQVYDGTTSDSNRVLHFCVEEMKKVIYSSQSNKIFIRFHLNKNNMIDEVAFRMRYSMFTKSKLH